MTMTVVRVTPTVPQHSPARPCSVAYPLNSHITPHPEGDPVLPLYRWGHGGPQQGGCLPKATWTAGGSRSGVRTQLVWRQTACAQPQCQIAPCGHGDPSSRSFCPLGATFTDTLPTCLFWVSPAASSGPSNPCGDLQLGVAPTPTPRPCGRLWPCTD